MKKVCTAKVCRARLGLMNPSVKLKERDSRLSAVKPTTRDLVRPRIRGV